MEERGLPLSPLTIAVAINGSKNSKGALKWALEKFVAEGIAFFRLIHIRPKITMVPTPMGNYLPISKVRDDVAAAYRIDVEMKTKSMLLAYEKMCKQRKVEAEAVVIEADNVAEALSTEVKNFKISKLVIGVSSRNIFTRKFEGSKMSSRISNCIPTFCTMYVVSKGKLSSVHPSTFRAVEDSGNKSNSSSTPSSILSDFSSGRSEWMNSGTMPTFCLPRSFSSQESQALKVIKKDFYDMTPGLGDEHHTRDLSISSDVNFMSTYSSTCKMQSINSTPSSCSTSQTDVCSRNSGQASQSDIMKISSPSQNEVNADFELEMLRIELRHLHGMHKIAQNETFDVSCQLNELRRRHEEEAGRLNVLRMREEKARQIAIKERERREEAEIEAEYVRECTEKEALHRIDAEEIACREAEEKERLERALACGDKQYKTYMWEEIESATLSFSDALMIGSGANGTVYKASFHHTVAAVKILHSNEGKGFKQFKQELEILGRIRHPHLLLLLGACPDYGCLVYEYMENGSLEDRLQCKNNTPPLPWHHRYRIAWEIASALVFLHNSKPDPIIHRDLKPANILLGNNLISKIGDVGLSTLFPPTMNFSMSTMYKDTAPVGTFFYIDPEYQRTGLLSPKSDIYALGIVILQLVTGKPPMGLAHMVETAVEDDVLVNILDSKAGQWPLKETCELALLGLSCVELRRKDRPELKDKILPTLEKLKDFADNVWNLASHVPSSIPGHFICPILQEVMEDPCIASDGYTYERRAIERWLQMNEKSPLTNMKLPNKNLVTNQWLLSAIKDWMEQSLFVKSL